MSRRYGRQQRRAARDRIKVLEMAHDMACTAAAHAQDRSMASERKIELLRDQIAMWDAEIRSLLGPYTSFAIDEPTYRVDHPDQIREMPVLPPLSGLPLGPAEIVQESISYHVETMLGFMCGLDEEILTRLRRLLTVRVAVGSDRDRERAYFAVSEQTWRQMKREGPNNPGLEWFIRRIAGDFVRLLVAPPKKKTSGDGLFPPSREAHVEAQVEERRNGG